jgi:hypothetical protein
MRLLHLQTQNLHEFFEDAMPPYAMLSHRWGDRELTYQDLQKKRNLDGPGYDKIISFCNLARNFVMRRTVPRSRWDRTSFDNAFTMRLEWGWVDTCCIDKSSSADLSEAINSMFAWYRDATLCCVYLDDVTSEPPTSSTTQSTQLMFELW